jgi:hypothetical protein
MSRAALQVLLDALEAGDLELAVQLVLDALEDGPVHDLNGRRRRCTQCGVVGWPGELEDHLHAEPEMRRAA